MAAHVLVELGERSLKSRAGWVLASVAECISRMQSTQRVPGLETEQAEYFACELLLIRELLRIID